MIRREDERAFLRQILETFYVQAEQGAHQRTIQCEYTLADSRLHRAQGLEPAFLIVAECFLRLLQRCRTRRGLASLLLRDLAEQIADGADAADSLLTQFHAGA